MRDVNHPAVFEHRRRRLHSYETHPLSFLRRHRRVAIRGTTPRLRGLPLQLHHEIARRGVRLLRASRCLTFKFALQPLGLSTTGGVVVGLADVDPLAEVHEVIVANGISISVKDLCRVQWESIGCVFNTIAVVIGVSVVTNTIIIRIRIIPST